MKKILFLCATSNSVKNFRRGLIKKFQDCGYRVGISAYDDDNIDIINTLDVDFFCVKMRNRSLNPFDTIKLKNYYKKLIGDYQPDVVLTFVLKPNTVGVNAANTVGIKDIYSMVEGAGDVFVGQSLKWKIIRKIACNWYKKSFKKVQKVFFLNNEDKNEFIKRKLIKEEKCEIIHGIGVDTDRFFSSPIQDNKTFLMISRMLEAKGVYEYCECARKVKQKFPNVKFNFVGAEASIKLEDIKTYIDDGSINYLGTTKDVRPFIEDATCFVLPSYYREGFPMSIMEAQSVGRCVITTDNVGCRDTVEDGYNGFLVPIRNVEALVEKCIWVLENKDKAIEMGKNARRYAEENFDSKIINEKIYSIISETNS